MQANRSLVIGGKNASHPSMQVAFDVRRLTESMYRVHRHRTTASVLRQTSLFEVQKTLIRGLHIAQGGHVPAFPLRIKIDFLSVGPLPAATLPSLLFGHVGRSCEM